MGFRHTCLAFISEWLKSTDLGNRKIVSNQGYSEIKSANSNHQRDERGGGGRRQWKEKKGRKKERGEKGNRDIIEKEVKHPPGSQKL